MRTAAVARTLWAVAYGEMVGKLGRVTATIPAGGERQGEIMVEGEAYHAVSADPQTAVAKGTRVVIVEYEPPRTVVVTPY